MSASRHQSHQRERHLNWMQPWAFMSEVEENVAGNVFSWRQHHCFLWLIVIYEGVDKLYRSHQDPDLVNHAGIDHPSPSPEQCHSCLSVSSIPGVVYLCKILGV